MVVLSLSDLLWSLLVLFFMVVYFLMLFWVVVDVFRRHDASGGTKALWLIALFVFPLLSLLVYMFLNGAGIAARNVEAASRKEAQFDQHIRETAPTGAADQIGQAKQLLDSGAISEPEFERLKAKALA